jgi:hypothetical protein
MTPHTNAEMKSIIVIRGLFDLKAPTLRNVRGARDR